MERAVSISLRRVSASADGWRRLRRWVAGAPLGALLILGTVVAAAVFAPLIAPHDPMKADLSQFMRPPAWQAGGDPSYLLGTDKSGRDVLSRLIFGSRIALLVGFTVVAIAGFIGTAVALVGGYFGGWVDALLGRITDAVMAIPFLLMIIALATILGPSLHNTILILAVSVWASYARILRGEVLSLKTRDYVSLARVAGASHLRILRLHIFPNLMNTLLVLASLQLGVMIIAEASLSFLGLGVQPPTPAWGSMLAEGRSFVTRAWWLAAFPGIAISLTVLGTNLLGDWLRVRLDPKYRQV